MSEWDFLFMDLDENKQPWQISWEHKGNKFYTCMYVKKYITENDIKDRLIKNLGYRPEKLIMVHR